MSDNAIASRNIQGLLNPLDSSGSGVARWAGFIGGIEEGFKNPAGNGTGATNAAGSALSNDSQGTAETDNDVADVFISMGAIGGFAYIVLILLIFRTIFRKYAATRNWMLFATMGVLIIMFGNWLNGGMYALSALTWFLVGWATRPEPEKELGTATEDEAEAAGLCGPCARLATRAHREGPARPSSRPDVRRGGARGDLGAGRSAGAAGVLRRLLHFRPGVRRFGARGCRPPVAVPPAHGALSPAASS